MRYSENEHAILVGQFSPNETVKIRILDLEHDLEISLINNICNESNTIPGIYLWDTKYIDTSKISTYINLLYEMTDSNNNKYYGKFVYGGYVDKLITDMLKLSDNSGTSTGSTNDIILKLVKVINARI